MYKPSKKKPADLIFLLFNESFVTILFIHIETMLQSTWKIMFHTKNYAISSSPIWEFKVSGYHVTSCKTAQETIFKWQFDLTRGKKCSTCRVWKKNLQFVLKKKNASLFIRMEEFSEAEQSFFWLQSNGWIFLTIIDGKALSSKCWLDEVFFLFNHQTNPHNTTFWIIRTGWM